MNQLTVHKYIMLIRIILSHKQLMKSTKSLKIVNMILRGNIPTLKSVRDLTLTGEFLGKTLQLAEGFSKTEALIE